MNNKRHHIGLIVLLITIFIGTFIVTRTFSVAASYDVAGLLAKYTPNTLHEAIPHGVPSNFDWRTKALLKNPTAPNAEMTYMNIRGAVYVDESNVRPANTRVAIVNCEAWGLVTASNTWEKFIDMSPSKMAGRGWKEDFSTPGAAEFTNVKNEADGSKSVITFDTYNYHYFNNTGQVPLVYVGDKYSEYITACSSRLVLNDPNGPDDRAQSAYIIDVGNDWKKADNTCTKNEFGATLCYGVGAGKFIRVENSWRRVVFSTLDADKISSKPLPPEEAFINPDGTYGDSTAATTTTPDSGGPSTGTPSTGSGTSTPSPSTSSGSSSPGTTTSTPTSSTAGTTANPSPDADQTKKDSEEVTETTEVTESKKSSDSKTPVSAVGNAVKDTVTGKSSAKVAVVVVAGAVATFGTIGAAGYFSWPFIRGRFGL